jgi:prevent-host-death family protein
MQQIEIADIRASLPSLLQRVESGDEILLTREGRPVARIIPEARAVSEGSELSPEQQARARGAMARIRALRDELKLGPFDLEQLKRDRDEGRP